MREPPHGHHHRPAAALQNSARDQHMNVARDAAEKRAQRENADRRREHAPRSEPVRHPPADRNENREAQRVACQHRLHAERSNMQRRRDRRHRGIQNRGVERLHEKRHRDQPRQQPLAGRSDGRRRRNRLGGTKRNSSIPIIGPHGVLARAHPFTKTSPPSSIICPRRANSNSTNSNSTALAVRRNCACSSTQRLRLCKRSQCLSLFPQSSSSGFSLFCWISAGS